jgi:hypothetical protein
MTGLLEVLRRLGPGGGSRCVPVREFLSARAQGCLEVERAFFAGLLLRNGIYKTTEAHRMDELLPLVVQHARTLPGPTLRVLDVACSSGVTTVELHRALMDAGLSAETTGTDLTMNADYVVREDGAAMLFDSTGRLLQVELGEWASPWRWRPRDRVYRPALVARARRLLSRDRALFLRARQEAVAGLESTRIALLSSQATRSADVRFREEDILAPAVEEKFSIIRVANLLNPDYFAPDILRRMLDALRGRLVEGGLLLIVRSKGAPPVHDGTLFRWSGDRFESIVQVGAGSEIAPLLVPDSGPSGIPVQ